MSASPPPPAPRRLVLVGDPHGLPTLLDAVPRERVVGLIGAEIRPQHHPALEALAAAWKLPLLIQPRATSDRYPAFLNAVAALAPELFLVYSYSMRLREELLALAPAGGLNLHGALLPQYRGASPLQNALLNGERETGATLHVMTPSFDDGPIVAQSRVPVHFADTWVDVYERIHASAGPLLAQAMPAILEGRLEARPQDEREAGYYPRRYPEDGHFEWTQPCLAIYHLIRALVRPHPGAFYQRGDDRVTLDRFLPLGRVVAMKYDPDVGACKLQGRLVALAPLEDPDDPWQAAHDRFRFAVAGPATPTGWLGFHHFDPQHRTAAFELNLPAARESSWQEAARLGLGFAFEELALQRVYARVPAADTALIARLEAAGFVKERHLPRAFRPFGIFEEVWVMRVLRSEFMRQLRQSRLALRPLGAAK
ncbi:MAG: formyltransferase family protein [Candidatus Sericytochromatia bacterium]